MIYDEKFKLDRKLNQALAGISQATALILKVKGYDRKNKRDGSYKLKSDLFYSHKQIMIPRDLEIKKSYDYKIIYKPLYKNSSRKYKFIDCRTLDDVIDCLVMLSNYVGDKIK